MSIQISEASKVYENQKAVDRISFSVNKGEIVGFLGPNGAGKSTTMKMLTGFVKPSSGSLFVNGIDISKNPIATKKSIGYLPEHNPLYKELYVKEYLEFCAKIHQVKNTRSVINEVIKKVGLTHEAHKKISQLSKGYQQRVGLASAILHNPSVLILDEPTTGLDPNQLVEIRALIKELGKDKTVLFSTHIMQEVEAICDRIIIIKKGEIVVDKLISELKNNNQQIIEVTFQNKVNSTLFKNINQLVDAKNTSENNWLFTFESEKDMRPFLFDFAKQNDLTILELKTKNQSLETLFREITR